MIRPLPPPYADPARVDALLGDHGHVALSPQGLAAVLGGGVDADDPLAPLAHYWGDLPVDAHLRDGGHYRRRRHGSYVVQGGEVRTVPHRAHWQPLDYNALHGGLMRWFEPLQDDFAGHAVLHSMLTGLTARAS
ncbi:MAG: 2OG-Fe dioxygenase family protein, partial [Planctomycetota bacterium]